MPPPKMWEGEMGSTSRGREREKDREREGSVTRDGKGRGDLTNVKLAKNQVVSDSNSHCWIRRVEAARV